jgi:hypothetical protein
MWYRTADAHGELEKGRERERERFARTAKNTGTEFIMFAYESGLQVNCSLPNNCISQS